MEALGLFVMIGLAAGGLAVGSGIFRGLTKVGLSMVRSAKIISNSMIVDHSNKYIYYSDSTCFNEAREKE
jgi:hypothetical protein